MDQYIGKMLDNRYEILECIGTGGMAVVYKARCHRLNRLVAVKILKSELASDAEFRRRFHDESQAVAMLSHSNIVAVYDVSRSDDLDYIVMELVDGLTLKQYMQKRGAPLNWREALHFITQIVRALGHAHSRGIIHRDIKPQNILVLRDGSVKVTDFGIARVASAAQATLTQEALGSVHYISPEQARGSHIDGRSDLYSAGVVLYEMLTGRLPFEGETPVSVAIQHINSIPIPPRDLNSGIPPALEAITLKAMAPKPENRYGSADEMLADLEEFRKNPEATPEHARKDEAAAMDEPTRVVPVAEIKQEQLRERRKSQQTPEFPERNYHQTSKAARAEAYDDYDEDEPRRRGVPPFLIAVLAILIFVGGMFFFAYNFFLKGLFTQGAELEVPDLMPYTLEQLEQDPTLYEGFTITVAETRESDEHDEGAIISQDPVAGSTVKEGADTEIKLVVSAGEETIYMPDLLGQESRSAMSALREIDLIPEPQYEYNDTVAAGDVIRTAPVANTPLRAGDTVTVVISQGKKTELTTVPNFLGMPIEQAKSAIEQAGLTLDEVSEFNSDEYPAGRVMYQSIAASKEVERGTEIDLYVSLGPETTEPPEPSNSQDLDPSNTAVIAATKTIEVDLSQFASETVHIRVEVDGKAFYDGTLNTSLGKHTVTVTGSGEARVTIYADGIPISTYMLDFSAGT